tara:strand:+ start:1313 stop:1744 length:432 start_codon:yes stop_codon:yes gene_type:complete
MSSSQKHTHKFAQAPWRIIREFAGIYGVKMDYSKFATISVSTIEDAINYSELFQDKFFISRMRRDHKYFRNPKVWKTFLLKLISSGCKSRKFYEEISQRILFKDITWRSQNAHLIRLKEGAEERIRGKRWARLKAKQAKWNNM